MIRIPKSGQINGTFHVLIWGIILLFPYLVSSPENDYRIGALPGLFFTIAGVIHMIIFYANAFYLFSKLFNGRFWWLYILASALLLAVSFWAKYQILSIWFPGTLKSGIAYRFAFAPSLGVYFISIVYRKVIDKIRFEKEQKEQQTEKLAAELKFLRSQISPHFIFNVLTNLISLARKKSDLLEPSLITLSELMRYMLYDTQGKKVALQKELEYLNSYISLQKLRFGDEVLINSVIEFDNGMKNYLVEPMLLIPFVENAFKHGTGCNDQSLIDIRLAVNEGIMTFEVRNKFDRETNKNIEASSGIGLKNVKTRLGLLYKNNHTLSISDNNNLFHIVLTLNLI